MTVIGNTPFAMPDTNDLTQKVKMGQQMEKLGNLQTAKAADPKKAKAAAQEFEATFISQMLGHMFEGVKTDEEFGGGEAEDIYRSMMIEQYGKIITKSGGIGIASTVYTELMKHQEIKNSGEKS